jgi:hypothetical protein
VPNPVVEVERLLADTDEAKKSATQALRSDDADTAEASLDAMLTDISSMRRSLLASGQDALVDRLDEAEEDLTSLKDSVVSHDPMFSMKLMTDSLAMSSRGRKPKTGKRRSPKASGSNGRTSGTSGDIDDSDQVASA